MNINFLNGLRVIESSAFIAAPLAGLTLAQSGADVIRIDRIGGGLDYQRMPLADQGRSLYWTGLNKNKRSVAVDIKRPEGQELIQALVTMPGPQSGVLLTNIDVPWLSHASLSKRRDDVITCVIEGNADGTTAVDYTVNCATGLPYMTGPSDSQSPVNHVLPAWDVACAHQAAFAIVSALHRRHLSGAGAEMRIALSDVAFATLSHIGMMTEVELFGHTRPALGNHLFGAFGRDFVTACGHRVFVACISLSQWLSLLRACNVHEEVKALECRLSLDLKLEQHRYLAREEIATLFEPWFSRRTLVEIRELFKDSSVCWGIYQTLPQAMAEDPRAGEANAMFERLQTVGVGAHLASGIPLREKGASRGKMRPAPLLGADTDEVLMDVLGLDSAQVGRLHDAGLVAGPNADPLVSPQHT